MKTMRSGGIAPPILNLGTRRMWVVNFTPRPLFPWVKSPWYPLDRTPVRTRWRREEFPSFPLPGIESHLSSSVKSKLLVFLYKRGQKIFSSCWRWNRFAVTTLSSVVSLMAFT